MTRVQLLGGDRLRRRRSVGIGAGSGLGCSAPLAFAAEPAAIGGGSSPWALVVTVLALSLALAASLWALALYRRQQQLRTELRDARAQSHGLRDLLDVWHWRTDTQHRLVLWRAPAGSPAAPRPAEGTSPAAWDWFHGEATAHDALRHTLQTHAPLNDLALSVTGPDGSAQSLLVRGTALLDAEGRFAGYQGTARPPTPGLVDWLPGLLQALPSPALHLSAGAAGEGRVIQTGNAAAARWLGLTEQHLPGMPWADLLGRVPSELRPVAQQAVAQPTADTLAGPASWELRVHPLPAPNGHEPSTLLIFHRATAEEADAPAPASEHESFGYTVSHDLRAPIRVVEGFTKIVKEDYGRLLDRIGNDHLDRVLGAASRMNSMIDALLALSQLSARPLSRQPVNLSQLVGYIVDDLRRQSPERHVTVDIEPGIEVLGDATLLRVALENLLGNAWKYTAKREQAHIWFERTVHEGKPACTVRDNGAGFDMRFADRLFGVFQRLHSANDFQGTGVGLASVRRIVRRHGGDIWAEGEVDRGARFQFWLPPA